MSVNPSFDTKIRPVQAQDVPSLKAIIDSTGLFPSELLDGMLATYLEQQSPTEHWITFADEHPVAVAYCAPERLTAGTYNLLLIAVHGDRQGQGIGGAVMRYMENLLNLRGDRLLLVETSGAPAFERTRSFYVKSGYVQEARIREFYAAGEDKIIFWKSLRDGRL